MPDKKPPSPFDRRHQALDLPSKLVVALERIAEAFRVALWNQAKQHGLSPLQVQILTFLHFHPPAHRKVSFIAREFHMTKATVSIAISTLVEKGLLRKKTSPDDARAFELHLTPSGTTLADEISGFSEPVREVMGGLASQEQELFLLLLLRTIEGLQRKGLVHPQRMCFNCRHFQRNGEEHYCQLLEKPLPLADLRVDCPEFEAPPSL